MAETLMEALGLLKVRIQDLTEANSRLQARIRDLEATTETYRQQAEAAKDQAEAAKESQRRAELDVEYLKVSYKLAADPDNLIATRRRIAQLIRNIDRCLEMLKE